jgi:hypothetical protein
MTEYIKNSYKVDAKQYIDNEYEVAAFAAGVVKKVQDGRVYIQTEENILRVCPTDYVVRSDTGKCYTWKKHMFEDVFVSA